MRARLIWAACAVVAGAFLVNAWFSFSELGVALRTTGRWYALLFYVPFGALLPAFLMARMAALEGPRLIGPGIGRSDAAGIVVAALAGAALAAFPLAPLAADPAGIRTLHRLFALLLIASFAEVMIFLGLVGNSVMAMLRARGHGPVLAGLVSGTASCVLFGLFHFTYPAPWNTLDHALLLALIWAGVALVFYLTHSLLAAVIFNNVMALVGFAQRGLDLPGAALEGWARAIAAVLIASLLFTLVKRRQVVATRAGGGRGAC
jgi:hypothetical protein